MDTKDIISLGGVLSSAITAPVGVYKLFKDASWFLPKTTKFSHILKNYPEHIEPSDVEFMKAEIKREVKKSILGISSQKLRTLVIYVRTYSELKMPFWQWGYLAPHIQCKYDRFFIRYKGKYKRCRWCSKVVSIFYLADGLIFFCWSLNYGAVFIGMSAVLMLLCIWMAFMFWFLFPGRGVIKKYNSQLLKIDASKYQAK